MFWILLKPDKKGTQMDQGKRKLMSLHKALHQRDDIDWLYVTRK